MQILSFYFSCIFFGAINLQYSTEGVISSSKKRGMLLPRILRRIQEVTSGPRKDYRFSDNLNALGRNFP